MSFDSSFNLPSGGLGEKWRLKKKTEEKKLESVSPEEENLVSLPSSWNSKHFLPLYFLVFLVFLPLFLKSFYLQVLNFASFREKATRHSLRENVISPPRGMIYDRNKKILAKNIPSFQLALIPSDLPQDENKKSEILKTLSGIFKIPISEIKEAISEREERPFEPIIIKENISYTEALITESKFDQFSGVVVLKEPRRQYDDSIFSHLLGYIGRINKEEYEELKNKGYGISELLGKSGLELSHEEELRGTPGRQILEVDASNRIIRHLADKEPQAGKSLILTIDSDLQKKVYEALSKGIMRAHKNRGAAVALNPQTGEVLALVSFPSFDNNLFTKGISKKEYQKISSDPNFPLFNRAISGTYPIGSTIKPVIASAGLQEGIINYSTSIYDPGTIYITNPYNPKIVYSFSCWKRSGHGWFNVIDALSWSCNVFFYHVGGGYKGFKGLGASLLTHYLELFGLGEKTGIDLPGEASGLVPTPSWKEKEKKEPWYLGDTYLLSIGQANLLVSPLQIANYTAAISNGGILYEPQLTKEILDPEGKPIKEFKSEVIRKLPVSGENLSIVREGMRKTITSGTAQLLSSLKVEVAGKTGTAQFGAFNEKSHAWFTAFAPYNKPQIVLTVLVEEGGEGSQVAVPIAREILEWYFKSR